MGKRKTASLVFWQSCSLRFSSSYLSLVSRLFHQSLYAYVSFSMERLHYVFMIFSTAAVSLRFWLWWLHVSAVESLPRLFSDTVSAPRRLQFSDPGFEHACCTAYKLSM